MARRPEQRCAVTTPQMDWLDDQRRKRAVSSDVIVRRMELMDVPPGSYDEKTLYDAVAEIKRLRAEVERLRAAGDALAHLMPHAHLSVPCRSPQGTPLDEWCSECAALAAWKEARRG